MMSSTIFRSVEEKNKKNYDIVRAVIEESNRDHEAYVARIKADRAAFERKHPYRPARKHPPVIRPGCCPPRCVHEQPISDFIHQECDKFYAVGRARAITAGVDEKTGLIPYGEVEPDYPGSGFCYFEDMPEEVALRKAWQRELAEQIKQKWPEHNNLRERGQSNNTTLTSFSNMPPLKMKSGKWWVR
jgi:hypothetical protein